MESNLLYKYFIPGLMVRIFGGVMVCLIYEYYYHGGDTINYFKGSNCMLNLMFKNFPKYVEIMAGYTTEENYMAFDQDTGYPPAYMYRDPKTFSVIRIVNLLVLFCCKSFLATTILLSALAYSGPWRLFLMFYREFPGLSRQLAFAILYIPSVFFWGSGLLKDTFTFSAICWYTFSFYKCFIVKEKRVLNFTFIVISLWVLVSIKPYLFVAIFPSSVLWYTFHLIRKVRGSMVRVVILPFALVVGLGLGYVLVSLMGSSLGKYELNTMVDVAIITQEDLSRSTYGPNSFDVGEIDRSISSLLSKAPIAIIATLFRPFIWEINNPLMFFSATENTIVLILVIGMFYRIRPLIILNIITSKPLILFSLIYSLILAYSIGLSTANFGALVRYKIPLIPFFVSSILIISYYYKLGDSKAILRELRKED